MPTTARVAAESLTTLDKRATFRDLRNCKAKSINVHVSGQAALLKLSTNDNGISWRGEYAETKIVIRVSENATGIVFTSGGPKTRKCHTVPNRDSISIDLSYLLAGYGAPISFVAARHGLRVVARVAGEDQLKTFGELFDERPHALTFGGLRFLKHDNVYNDLVYICNFDERSVIRVTIDSRSGTVTVQIEPKKNLNYYETLKFTERYYERQTFAYGELKQAFAFLNSVVDQNKIKEAFDGAWAEINKRRRSRRAMTKQSKLWPVAVQINGVILHRVKASRDYSDGGNRAPSVTDKTLFLQVQSVFSVKYESPRTEQDGKKIYSFQLHVSPETGEFIVGWRGPNTKTVTAREGKARHGTVGSPADLQKIIDATAKFLLPYMQKRNITSQKQPSASIINMRGADV